MFPYKQIAKNRVDGFAIGAGGDIFAEGRAGLAGDEVIGIRPAAMRHDGQVIGRRMGRDAQKLGHAAHPHHIGLHDIQRALFDQAAIAEAGVFVLAGRPFQRGVGLFDLAIPFDVIRRQDLLPPIDIKGFARLGQADGIGHVQRHVAIDHQRIARPDGSALSGQKIDIAAQARLAVVGAFGQRHFCPPEAQRLDRCCIRAGAIKADLVP